MKLSHMITAHLKGEITYGQLVDWAIAHHYSLAHLDYVLEQMEKAEV